MNIRGIQVKGTIFNNVPGVVYVKNVKGMTIDTDLGSVIVKQENVEDMVLRIQGKNSDWIDSLAALCEAVKKKKSVICPVSPCFNIPLPAAFIQNMQGVRIMKLIEMGLFIYKKKEPQKGFTKFGKRKVQ
jgi:hypothetical protein